ncbi:MAG: tryptophan 7-halogenase, partial [Hyphomonadaceae bacterium]|nr:tryptophan 7-halogenase [Hyphomonadaceae bacterium]
MMQQPLRILIVGGGTAGWMAACLLAQRWRERPMQITLLESPEIGIIGVGEGSTPQLRAFFKRLGLSERDWMRRCNATYKTGIRFDGWSEKPGAESYFHPFA